MILTNLQESFRRGLEILAVSSNKQLLAVGLSFQEKCRIAIYEIATIKRRKTLISRAQSHHLVSMKFSYDSKYLLTLYGSPDYLLVCWSIEKFKLIASTTLNLLHVDLSNEPLNLQTSFNPNDSSSIVITGNHIFRRHRIVDGRFKSVPSQKHEMGNFKCHCWLNNTHILVALDPGVLWIVKHGDIVRKYNVIQTLDLFAHSFRHHSRPIVHDVSPLKSRPPSAERQTSETLDTSGGINVMSKNNNTVYCLLPYTRGVFISIGARRVFMYERAEHSDQLTYLRELLLPTIPTANLKLSVTPFLKSQLTTHEVPSLQYSTSDEQISSLALSPNEETLLAATNYNQLYEISFSKVDYTKKEACYFTYALDGAHKGPILAVCACIRKPVIVTLGSDRYLKIWNLQTKFVYSNSLSCLISKSLLSFSTQELKHLFTENPISLSLHPTGVFIVVSFTMNVCIYGYTIDGLSMFYDFQVVNAKCIEYSNEGHLLAIAHGNTLELHQHSDYDVITYLRGNTAMVNTTYERKSFMTPKSLGFFELLMNIRDLTFPCDDFVPTTLAVSRTARALLIGTHKGYIYCARMLQHQPAVITSQDFTQISAHFGSVNKVVVSFSNQMAASAGEDGNLVLYNYNEYQQKKEFKIVFRDEILAQETVLKEQSQQLSLALQREYDTTKQYQQELETKEHEYISHLKELDAHYQENIKIMQEKVKSLKEEQAKLIEQNAEELEQTAEEYELRLKEYAASKNENLKIISTREQLLIGQIKNLANVEHEQMELATDSYDRSLERTHLLYQQKMDQIRHKFESVTAIHDKYFLYFFLVICYLSQERLSISERIDELQEVKVLLDEDSEKQLVELSEHYEKTLKSLLNKTQEMENESVMLEARLQQLEEESHRFEEQLKVLESEREELIQSIRQIDTDISTARETVSQRDLLQRIVEMERRREELEKFAYVFNYKISELTSQIGPREHEVKQLLEQFDNMDAEYDVLSKQNDTYGIRIGDLKARLRATEKELMNETSTIRLLNQTATNMKEDFEMCCQSTDQPKVLVATIRKLYGKYILNNEGIDMAFGQMSINDCDRQRAYFERSHIRLQQKVIEDSKSEKLEENRRIQEQINMMREISSHCLKVAEAERTLADIEIAYHISVKTNAQTPQEILQTLSVQQGSHFVQQKQTELDGILELQQKRIEQLRAYVLKINAETFRVSRDCEIDVLHALSSSDENPSIDRSPAQQSIR
ncbi:unnamed protein product [Didymodactylos carnosus]|uniref:Cilia- and flagella-associated protein 57 n=1 Tax=Didymodactylos carnosus TaxID=1234261 RepID=A0A8S2KHA2_9BILA|nr:unnamed protein product [Didymodactylos carnosus]